MVRFKGVATSFNVGEINNEGLPDGPMDTPVQNTSLAISEAPTSPSKPALQDASLTRALRTGNDRGSHHPTSWRYGPVFGTE
jgi:hypothetical protein